MEATPGIEPGIRALQAPALPLGHVASLCDRPAPNCRTLAGRYELQRMKVPSVLPSVNAPRASSNDP